MKSVEIMFLACKEISAFYEGRLAKLPSDRTFRYHHRATRLYYGSWNKYEDRFKPTYKYEILRKYKYSCPMFQYSC
jgi:hypothetical protein